MRLDQLFEGDVINFSTAARQLHPYPLTQGHPSPVILGRKEPEWNRAWRWLREIEESAYGYDIDSVKGEQWQYMETDWLSDEAVANRPDGQILQVADGIEGAGYYHCFRIRWHPTMHARIYRMLPSSRGWKPSYQDVLAGKQMIDTIHGAVDQMAKQHPDVFGTPDPAGD